MNGGGAWLDGFDGLGGMSYLVVKALISPRILSGKLRFRSTLGPIRSGESSILAAG